MSSETEIRPFRVDMPDEAIADLRRRIVATRWPSRELVADRSQGVQLATIQELARYWATEYDWRACEARLNARADQDIQGDRLRLLPRAGHPAADDRLRPDRFTYCAGGLDARPRHRRLLQDLPRLHRRAALRNLTRNHILDNIMLYWLTGTGASAARSYWESARAQALAAGQAPPPVKLPVGFTTFPGEIFRAPRSWVELGYPNLTYFHEADRGGHFAAWEEPEVFATEIRAAFRPLR